MWHSFFKKEDIRIELARLNAYLDRDLLREAIQIKVQNQGRNCTNAQAKKWLIANVLFGNPDQKGNSSFPAVKEFAEIFPQLYEIIKRLKRYWIKEDVYGYKEKDRFGRSLKWKAFPRLLQRMESDLFVQDMKDTPTDFITLHDAILTNEKGLIIVKQRLEEIIKRRNANIKLNFKSYAR